MKNRNVALRRWRESDADALFALASDPIVGQMARFPVHADKEESLRVIREIFCKPEFYAVVSREDGAVIGSISLHPETKGADVYDAEELTIGYWMGKPYWGRGFMTEAVKMLCGRCRTSGLFGCKRIIGFTSTDNVGSQRVMEKAGFRHIETKDGTVRYAYDIIENSGESNEEQTSPPNTRKRNAVFASAVVLFLCLSAVVAIRFRTYDPAASADSDTLFDYCIFAGMALLPVASVCFAKRLFIGRRFRFLLSWLVGFLIPWAVLAYEIFYPKTPPEGSYCTKAEECLGITIFVAVITLAINGVDSLVERRLCG